MKKITQILVTALVTLHFSLFVSKAHAQTELWITGSAVPGGVQKLVTCPEGNFKYAGTLNEGELKIQTTETPEATTKYFTPRYVQSYIINNGIEYSSTTNANGDSWIVPFTENRYRIVVNIKNRKVTGELFVPWKELFMAGGAVSCGWQAFVMEQFTQDANDPNIFTWTGKLANGLGDANEQPLRFKLMGQDTWDPKSFHPYQQDEPILESTQMRYRETDDKWAIDRDGIYRITVNVFHETIHAEYLGIQATENTTGIASPSEGRLEEASVQAIGNTVRVKGNEKLHVALYTADSLLVAKKSGKDVELTIPKRGLYFVQATGKRTSLNRKILVE